MATQPGMGMGFRVCRTVVNLASAHRPSPMRDIQNRLNLANPNAHLDNLRLTRGSRVHGTCRWIDNTRQMRRWRSGESRLLLLTGRRGTGKTELVLYLIDKFRARETTTEDNTPATIFFLCSSGDRRRSSGIAVLQGLLYHLCKAGRFLQYLVQEYERYRPPNIDVMEDFAVLWSVFEKCLRYPAAQDAVIIIDGLDECENESRDRLLKCLTWLAQDQTSSGVRFKMVLSSRQERVIPQQLTALGEHLITTTSAIDADIHRFVRDRVAELARNMDYSTVTQDALRRELLAKHGGTFLWLEIVTRHLRILEPSEDDVLDRTRSLPKDLQALYDRMLKQASRERFEDIYFLLNILAVSFRNLTKEEVLAAFQLRSPGWSHPSQIRLHGNEYLFSRCSDLVVVDNDTQTVRFFNESVKEYLTGDLREGQPLLLLYMYTTAAMVMLTMVLYVALRLIRRYAAVACVALASLTWIFRHKPDSVAHSIDVPGILALLAQSPGVNGIRIRHHVSVTYAHFWMFRIAFKWLGHEPLHVAARSALTTYAQQFFHKHAAASSNLTRWLFPWQSDALLKNHFLRDLWLRQSAASGGAFLQRLLDAGADPNASDERGWTALRWAIANNDKAVVQQLLGANADPDQKDPNGESLIMWIIGQAVDCIVYENIDIHGDEFSALMDMPGWTKTQSPSERWPGNQYRAVDPQKHEILKELIVRSKMLDEVDPQGRTALSRAAGMHDWRAILVLLNAGADANIPDSTGATPLLSALRAPRTTVVFRDLNFRQAAPAFLGSFVGPRNPEDPAMAQTEQHGCLEQARKSALSRLLQTTRNLDAIDVEGRTAFSYAVENGDASVVDALLQGNEFGKPSLSTVDLRQRSPLMWACCQPRFRILRFERLNIMDSAHVYLGAIHFVDAEANRHEGYGLVGALEDERRQIVDLLLGSDIDINHVSRDGCSALSLASQNGLNFIVQLLLARGARPRGANEQPLAIATGWDIQSRRIYVRDSATSYHGFPTSEGPTPERPHEVAAMDNVAAHCPRASFEAISAHDRATLIFGSTRNACLRRFGRGPAQAFTTERVSFDDVVVDKAAKWHCDLDVPRDWVSDPVPSLDNLLSLPTCTFSDIIVAGAAKVEMGNTVFVRHGGELWAVTSQHPGNTFRRISIEDNARVRSSLFTAMLANGIARWTVVALLGLVQSQEQGGY